MKSETFESEGIAIYPSLMAISMKEGEEPFAYSYKHPKGYTSVVTRMSNPVHFRNVRRKFHNLQPKNNA